MSYAHVRARPWKRETSHVARKAYSTADPTVWWNLGKLFHWSGLLVLPNSLKGSTIYSVTSELLFVLTCFEVALLNLWSFCRPSTGYCQILRTQCQTNIYILYIYYNYIYYNYIYMYRGEHSLVHLIFPSRLHWVFHTLVQWIFALG